MTKAKCRTRNVTLREMYEVKLQKSWISYKPLYANADMKNSVIAVRLQWQRIEDLG